MKINTFKKIVLERIMQKLSPEGRIKHSQKIKKLQNELKAHLVIKDGCRTVHTKGVLSKGCKLCKEGKWLCIFTGYNCDLACSYCPQDNKDKRDTPGYFRDHNIEDLKCCLDVYAKDHLRGIAYSGGEPFMYLDGIYDFARFVSLKHPYIYQWIYTNGLLATEDHFKKLAACGIKEIRFHLLATNFSKKVMDKLPIARKYFKTITIEIPSLPSTYKYLIKKGLIHKLEEYGVDQINLEELMYSETNCVNMPEVPAYKYASYFYNIISPTSSRPITYKIIKYVLDNKVKILIQRLFQRRETAATHEKSNESPDFQN